jgi:hypothetical protein
MHHHEQSHGQELDRHFGHVDHRHHGSSERHEAARGLAKGLGWFSIALGLAELAAPHAIAKSLGLRGKENLIQAYGLREIVTGAGILASANPAPWLWGRVAGDGLDLATLAAGLHHGNRQRRNVEVAMAAVGAVTLLDVYAAQQMSEAAKTMYEPSVDYSDRDGYPKGISASRGAAKDFKDPAFSAPAALKPWKDGKPQNGWSEPGGGKKVAAASASASGAAASKIAATSKLGGTVTRDTAVLGSASGSGKSAAVGSTAPLQQAASESRERDDAFKTGSTFTGSGNEGP